MSLLTLKKPRSILALLAAATLFALTVRLFFLEDFRVASDSMAPALLSGDLLLVSKAHYGLRLPRSPVAIARFRDPSPGQIVAFSTPDRTSTLFIKRIVAVGGDRLEIRQGRLYLNEVPVKYTPAPKKPDQLIETLNATQYKIQPSKDNYGPIEVPKGHFFVLGDNRRHSMDSRAWGPIPNSFIRGRASLVWFSVSPWGDIRRDRIGTWVQ